MKIKVDLLESNKWVTIAGKRFDIVNGAAHYTLVCDNRGVVERELTIAKNVTKRNEIDILYYSNGVNGIKSFSLDEVQVSGIYRILFNIVQ